jgi:hypothetical protein
MIIRRIINSYQHNNNIKKATCPENIPKTLTSASGDCNFNLKIGQISYNLVPI